MARYTFREGIFKATYTFTEEIFIARYIGYLF
jgi:hypothetical protein